MRITLLGPQRRPRIDSVARSLGLAGPVATVTAGWQDRESDDDELDALLSGRSVNLLLGQRFADVMERDPEFAQAHLARRARLAELDQMYLVRLDHACQAVLDLNRRGFSADALQTVGVDAEQAVRELDAAQLRLVGEVHDEFYAAMPPHDREVVATHRQQIADILAQCQGVAIAGGHVGALADALHLFNLAASLTATPAAADLVLLAWSAGAMALTERIVLFHDRIEHGPAAARVYEAGLGLVHGVVALPAAHRRLRLDQTVRMGFFARRFEPAHCLVLEAGDRVDLTPDGTLPAVAPILGDDGRMVAERPVGDPPAPVPVAS